MKAPSFVDSYQINFNKLSLRRYIQEHIEFQELAQQFQNTHRFLIRMGKHRGTGVHQDLIPGKFRHSLAMSASRRTDSELCTFS